MGHCIRFLHDFFAQKLHLRTLSLDNCVAFLSPPCITLLQRNVIAMKPWIDPRSK